LAEIMLRSSLLACALTSVLLANGARAETAIERGNYLVNTIMACGNCHSPRDSEGSIIADMTLSGGLTFDTPAFLATAPNITPDVETGIGSWSEDEIKRSLIEGMRPNHGKLAGVALAAIMPANFYKVLLPEDLAAVTAYLRSIKPVRNEVAAPVYRLPVHRVPYPAAEAGFN
jgi:mono/diheme cytochrome c family protein